MTLYETRIKYNLSQIEAANIIGVPIRTLRRYETDESYGDSIKRRGFINSLESHCEITETKGLLSIKKEAQKKKVMLIYMSLLHLLVYALLV